MKKLIDIALKIVNNSLKMKSGETLFIELHDTASLIYEQIIKVCKDIDVKVITNKTTEKHRLQIRSSLSNIDNYFKIYQDQKIKADATLRLLSENNVNAYEHLDESLNKYFYIKECSLKSKNNSRFVKMYWPNIDLANSYGLSYEKYEQMIMDTIMLDWDEFNTRSVKLHDLWVSTNNVKLVGNKTNIQFSIKDNVPIIEDSFFNVPGGEIFGAPVLNSINGTITFNIKTEKMGYIFDEVTLEYKDGELINYSCLPENNLKHLETILNLDEGANKFGEFAIQLNFNFINSVTQVSYDEKIGGGVHFALGSTYKYTSNGNDSLLHWDLIHDTKLDNSVLYFDEQIVFKNGKLDNKYNDIEQLFAYRDK